MPLAPLAIGVALELPYIAHEIPQGNPCTDDVITYYVSLPVVLV